MLHNSAVLEVRHGDDSGSVPDDRGVRMAFERLRASTWPHWHNSAAIPFSTASHYRADGRFGRGRRQTA